MEQKLTSSLVLSRQRISFNSPDLPTYVQGTFQHGGGLLFGHRLAQFVENLLLFVVGIRLALVVQTNRSNEFGFYKTKY